MNILKINKNINKKYEELGKIEKFNTTLVPFGMLSLLSIGFGFTWLTPVVALFIITFRGIYLYSLSNSKEVQE